MSHRGRRNHISENFFEQKIALGLSFRLSHHVALAPLSCEKKNHYSRKKCHFFCQNFQLQSALISEFVTRWEVSHIRACSARRVLSEYTSHTLGSFLELYPLDEVWGCAYYELKLTDSIRYFIRFYSTWRSNCTSGDRTFGFYFYL